MKIGVFCSANNNISETYFEETQKLGKWIGENGHSLVYGGCNIGLMDCVAQATKEANGMVIGIVPKRVETGGKMSNILDVTFHTENLSDRKDLFVLQSEVLVALPGGIGTLDEIFTVAASHTIGYHDKMVILYNVNGFYNTTISLLNDFQEKGMIRGEWKDYILCANTFEELTSLIEKQA